VLYEYYRVPYLYGTCTSRRPRTSRYTTVRTRYYSTHVSSGGTARRKKFGRESQIQIRNTGDPVRQTNETGHSTIDTLGLIVLPLRVTETQIEVKVMSRLKRSPIEVTIYRLENYHQVGSGALYKLSRLKGQPRN
jgi:hypothetical protein